VLKIAVRVPRRFEDAGEYLADARALDAAGVDSLWLDGAGGDPWLILAACAAVTGRVRLVVPVDPGDAHAAAALEDRLVTLRRLSRGRVAVAVAAEGDGTPEIVAAARRCTCPVIVPAADAARWRTAALAADGVIASADGPEALLAALTPALRGRADAGQGPLEVWVTVPMPADRARWRATRAAYEPAGATGLIVPADPRLLDLLRNGDEEEDRSDLSLAQG
jgi:hypothetical protein